MAARKLCLALCLWLGDAQEFTSFQTPSKALNFQFAVKDNQPDTSCQNPTDLTGVINAGYSESITFHQDVCHS